MLKRLSSGFALLALLALSAPVFAKTFSQNLDLTQPATIASTTLQPGQYKFTANLNSDRVQVKQNGKLVATIHGRTINLKQKSPYNAVVFNKRQIHEIQFSGKTQAIELPNS